MLNRGINIFLFILVGFAACQNPDNSKEKLNYLYSSNETRLGKDNYINIYKSLQDSFRHWIINRLPSVEAEMKYQYNLDSLLCFNNSQNRFISCVQIIANVQEATSDELEIIYGEKINGSWYFFKGSTILIPRELFKNQDIHKPLTYDQLHQRALQDIFAPYLVKNEINESWFTSHFEHIGWGDIKHQEYDDWCFKGKRYTNIHEYYQACHLCKVKANWAGRDTTQPVKQLPAKQLP